MYYVYILHSANDGKFYTGCTNDLKRRVREHNAGRVESTRQRKPLDLVHYEAFVDKHDAFAREQWYKTGWGRQHQYKMLANTIKNFGGNDTSTDKFTD